MQTIKPFLWFNGQAEEAANFYVSVFKDAEILEVARYGEAGPGVEGEVMVVKFRLKEQEFYALNAGPQYTFNPAISFLVHCETQQEIDDYWAKLTDGGQELSCGWLTDKFGVSWQICPTIMPGLLQDEDKAKAKRVMEAMMGMVKFDIVGLEKAYEGE